MSGQFLKLQIIIGVKGENLASLQHCLWWSGCVDLPPLLFCEENQIDLSKLETRVSYSEIELPKILAELGDPCFDIALIDGSHGWPYTFIDLYGMNAVLKVGGYLILDDLQLHSVKEMAKFISADNKNWRTHTELGKAVIFQKITDRAGFGDWDSQPYITAMSHKISLWQDPFSYKPFEN